MNFVVTYNREAIWPGRWVFPYSARELASLLARDEPLEGPRLSASGLLPDDVEYPDRCIPVAGEDAWRGY